jgi:hypothetical protein
MRQRDKLVEELDRLEIPAFELPWDVSVSPHVDSAQEQTIEWSEHHCLFPSAEIRSRAQRTKYAWLAGRCYPNADREYLQIIADYFSWYFLADDLFVDRVELFTPHTVPNLTALIDVLDFDRVGPNPVFGEIAWTDLCRRLRRRLSSEHFERFANGMRLWASVSALQILFHERPCTLQEWDTIRRYSSGMFPCLDLGDGVNAEAMTSGEFLDQDVQALRLRANNYVCYTNDIDGLAVELRQPGQSLNGAIIYALECGSLQQAVDYFAGRIDREVRDFVRLAEQVEARSSDRVRGYIEGLRSWMRGYREWAEADSTRYSADHAAEDADDTLVGASYAAGRGP